MRARAALNQRVAGAEGAPADPCSDHRGRARHAHLVRPVPGAGPDRRGVTAGYYPRRRPGRAAGQGSSTDDRVQPRPVRGQLVRPGRQRLQLPPGRPRPPGLRRHRAEDRHPPLRHLGGHRRPVLGGSGVLARGPTSTTSSPRATPGRPEPSSSRPRNASRSPPSSSSPRARTSTAPRATATRRAGCRRSRHTAAPRSPARSRSNANTGCGSPAPSGTQ